MGNTPISTNCIDVALREQIKPAHATKISAITTHPTAIKVALTDIQGDFHLRDAHSDALLTSIHHTRSGSSRRILCSPSGDALLTLKSKSKENAYYVYGGDATVSSDSESEISGASDTSRVGNDPLFRIQATRKPGFPLIVYTDFKNLTSGENCRLLIEGDDRDRLAIAYLQRVHGTALPPILPQHNARSTKVASVEPVGRIRRVDVDRDLPSCTQVAYVEAPQGVDMTLLSLLWYVRHEVFCNSERKREVSEEAKRMAQVLRRP